MCVCVYTYVSIYTYKTESLCCAPEANAVLEIKYTSIGINKRFTKRKRKWCPWTISTQVPRDGARPPVGGACSHLGGALIPRIFALGPGALGATGQTRSPGTQERGGRRQDSGRAALGRWRRAGRRCRGPAEQGDPGEEKELAAGRGLFPAEGGGGQGVQSRREARRLELRARGGGARGRGRL